MINEQIRDREVRLIGEDGEQLGIMSSREAMKLAAEANLDLVKHILDDFAALLEDVAVVEKPAKMEGRSMSMVLTEKR